VRESLPSMETPHVVTVSAQWMHGVCVLYTQGAYMNTCADAQLSRFQPEAVPSVEK